MERRAAHATEVVAWMFVVLLGFGSTLYAASTTDAQNGSLNPRPSAERKAGGDPNSLNPQPLPPAPSPLSGEMRKAGGDPHSLNPQPLPPMPSPSGEMRKAGGDPNSLNPQPLPPAPSPSGEMRKAGGDSHSLNPQPLPPVVGPDAQKLKGKFGGPATDSNLTRPAPKSRLTGSDGGVGDIKSRHAKSTHLRKSGGDPNSLNPQPLPPGSSGDSNMIQSQTTGAGAGKVKSPQ